MSQNLEQEDKQIADKYYIPSIEEFHVGFECEIETSWGYSKGVWPEILKLDTLMGFEQDIIKATKQPVIRVKYLDKEDIESFGFKFRGRAVSDYYKLEKMVRLLSGHWFTEFIIQHDRNNKFIDEEDHSHNIIVTGVYPGGEDTLFEGIVKNKSELKHILKQIGVWKNT